MASKDTKLKIVVDAQNKATQGLKGASNDLKTLEGASHNVKRTFNALYLAAAAATAAIGAMGLNAIKAGAQFEQTQIAFEVMLGSADRAKTLLEELSVFATETPFELVQLEEASKRLMAYGVEADNLIPTLKMLGDITAGVGMEKLPQLILAFGQVKAATKLTGMELRQFTEAGVPMLDALVQHFNKTAKTTVSVSNAAGLTKKEIEKLGSETERYEKKLHSLNITLEKQLNRQKQMRKDDKDSGATWKNLGIDIEETRRKIGETEKALQSNNATMGLASQTITKFGSSAKVTAADIQEMVSDGKVSFSDVEAALASMTEEGGKFHELMARQATTLGGLWSNLKDQIELTSRALGVEMLPYLKPVVANLISMLETLRTMRTNMADFTNGINQSSEVIKIFHGLWMRISEHFQKVLTPAWQYLKSVVSEHKEELKLIGEALLILGGIIASEVVLGVINALALAIRAVGFAIDVVVTSITTLADWLDTAYNKMKQLIDLAKENTIGRLKFWDDERAAGGPVSSSKTYLVGENGPELFSPNSSGTIIPNHQLSASGGGMTINISGNTFMSDEDAATEIGDMIMSKLKLSTAF